MSNQPDGGHPRWLPKLLAAAWVIVFLVATAVSLVAVARFASHRRALRLEIQATESTRDKLQEIADQISSDTKPADIARGTVWSVLRQCRTAEDVPTIGGERIFACHQGAERLCFAIPEGDHTLVFSTTWKPKDADTVSPESPPPSGEKSWRIPLLPTSGYLLVVSTERKGGPIRWTLSSNHPDFTTQSDELPLDAFAHRGASWSGSQTALFPNQIEEFTVADVIDATKARPGIQLMTATLFGAREEIPYEVRLEVRVASAGPVCVSASHAQRLIVLGREDLLGPYHGGGRYEIVEPNDPPDD